MRPAGMPWQNTINGTVSNDVIPPAPAPGQIQPDDSPACIRKANASRSFASADPLTFASEHVMEQDLSLEPLGYKPHPILVLATVVRSSSRLQPDRASNDVRYHSCRSKAARPSA